LFKSFVFCDTQNMKEKIAKKNPGGQPTKLTDEIAKAIIRDVGEYLSVNFAAEANDQPRSTVWTWIDLGRRDREAGIESIFTKFSAGIKKARAHYVHDAVKDIRDGISSWQGTAWLLERCCAEDFGKDSELYKSLLEDYKMLMQSLVDQNKGVNHGG
jgi:hypothetical protein